MSFNPKSKDKAGELSTYRDMRFQGSLTDQERLLSQSTTLYIGNLSYFTSEEQVWELFRRTGDIRRVIMGLDRFQKTPCGFCFVEYYTRADAEDALRYVNGTRLDDRVIRCDWDAGFKEGRQYGRGKHGGQVRDEYRQNFDAGRGGWNKTIQKRSEHMNQRVGPKNSMLLNLFCFLTTFKLLYAVGVDIDLTVDRSGWVDPSDPLSNSHYGNTGVGNIGYDCGEKFNILLKENSEIRERLNIIHTARENSVDVLMKHVLRNFLSKLNIDVDDTNQPVFKKAQVSLSVEDLSVLKRYLQSEKTIEEFGLREDLRFALENFLVEADVRSQNSILALLHSILPYLMLLNLLLILPASVILIRWVCSFRRLCFVVFVSAFGISYYFAYIRKYQEVLAQRFERANWDSSKHSCTPRGLMSEAFDVLLSYVTIKDKSDCLKSYEDMLIEPILLVDPLQVLAEVLSNFVLSPFSIAGLHLNRFFIRFFENTPIPLALLMAVLLCLMPVLIVWIVLRIREHLANERREDERKGRLKMIDHSSTQPCLTTLPADNVTEERERRLRRRAIGHDRSSSVSSLREIRERMRRREIEQ
uniref:Chloride channel CLIC-like protein 1 n=1 Tax=Meloidogyne enterolobii TaxID=390850 RepID=A0A6V7UYF7_MELEN|nr:unnamed protein product [Meloidogyne enterolobii]